MRVRAALAVLVVIGAVVATGGTSGTAGAGEPARAGRSETVTARGVLERLVVETTDGEVIRYMVRGDDEVWWLTGVSEPAPDAGSRVLVTGTPRNESTLSVDSLRVVTTTGATAAIEMAAVRGTTRVLVLRAYWGSRPPARPTTTTTGQRVISASRAWFNEVSHGRYTVEGSVTPWLKVSPPSDCYGGSGTAGSQALAAAQRRGFRLSSYTRFIIYLPCNAGGILGYASLPGQYVVLFNNMDRNVVMHEQGHNLGLPHASSRECRRSRLVMTWSSNCAVSEYGDEIDSMGNRRAGHFNAFYKSKLGWLQRAATVTSSRTVTLARYETTGPGLKAVRVRAGAATYWLEYRTRTGADRELLAGTDGVQVRYQIGGRTQLLDAGPESTSGYYDFADTHLPVGSSWTSPQNVRFTVTGQTSSGATVAIRFHAGAPTRPNAPGQVRAQAQVLAARITWTRPADNGAIIRQYRITRSDGVSRVVRRFAGLPSSYTWTGLSSSRTYSFRVQAINHVGASRAVASNVVRPLTDAPSVVIDSPVAGATVQGIVPVRVTPTPNRFTKTPIDHVELYVDNKWVTTDFAAPWALSWNTLSPRLTNGAHTLRVVVRDRTFKQASTSRQVTVSNPTPTVTITSPTNGATVSDDVDVTYTLAPAGENWQWVELDVDGSGHSFSNAGEPLTFDAVLAGPSTHTLRVRAGSAFETYESAPISVTVPTPSVTISSPSPGAAMTESIDVTYSLSPTGWDWYQVDLFVDDQWATSAAPGDPLVLDPTTFGTGPHVLRVSAYDEQFRLYDSPGVDVTVPEP